MRDPPELATDADAAAAPETLLPVPAEKAPACEPCSYDCLDEADAVKESDSPKAKALAQRSCEVETCGYIGTAMLLRCKEYGFLTDARIIGPGMP